MFYLYLYRSSLLGKILRVNIDDASVADNLIRYYSIPPDNPDVNGLPEIYAWGFRNPWRCSLDIGKTFCNCSHYFYHKRT